jgi:hypothetical protein
MEEKKVLNIFEKLVNIQSELKAPKGQYNSFGKYKYRSAEDILEAVKPLCHTHGTVLTISDELVYLGDRYYIKATAKLNDIRSGAIENTAYAREEESKKGMDGSQITGTASSYARKYALNGLFAIDDTKDADTDEHANQTKQEETKASKGQLELFKTLLNNDDTKISAYLEYFKVKSIDDLTNEQINKAVKIIQEKKKENAQAKE